MPTPSKSGWFVPEANRIVSPNFNSRTRPIKMVVMHTTVAPRETRDNRDRIERWFRNKGKSSTHFCILRDGTILQGVSTLDMAWHAGESSWARLNAPKSSTSVNQWAIGIDFDTLGRLKSKGGELFDCYGKKYTGNAVELNGRWFDPFTFEQIDAVRCLLPILVEEYKIDVKDVVGHCDVSPGRKTDPEPIFPWGVVLSSIEYGCEPGEMNRLKRYSET